MLLRLEQTLVQASGPKLQCRRLSYAREICVPLLPDFRLTLGSRWSACRNRLLGELDRKSTRLNSSHLVISYAVFCLKKKKTTTTLTSPPSSTISSISMPPVLLRNSLLVSISHFTATSPANTATATPLLSFITSNTIS